MMGGRAVSRYEFSFRYELPPVDGFAHSELKNQPIIIICFQMARYNNEKRRVEQERLANKTNIEIHEPWDQGNIHDFKKVLNNIFISMARVYRN